MCVCVCVCVYVCIRMCVNISQYIDFYSDIRRCISSTWLYTSENSDVKAGVPK